MKKFFLMLVILNISFATMAAERRRTHTLTSKTKLETYVYVVHRDNMCNLPEKLKDQSPESIRSLEKECGIEYLDRLANREDVIAIPLKVNGAPIHKIIVANAHGNVVCDVNSHLVVYTGGKSKILKTLTGYSAGSKIQCMSKREFSGLADAE